MKEFNLIIKVDANSSQSITETHLKVAFEAARNNYTEIAKLEVDEVFTLPIKFDATVNRSE